jgi:branched-chain amino acid aminotransferase
MVVFLNGKFVAEGQARISVFDRSFLYGDGLFETMRVAQGRPIGWKEHLNRMRAGAKFLGIRLPFAGPELRKFAAALIVRNRMPESLLRLTVSRGVGLRGYSPRGAESPTVAMSLHPAPPINLKPPGWQLHIASPRLPANEPISYFKTCNKLAQVVARTEADREGADEALLCNTLGFVVEGASSNLFWLRRNQLCTAPLASGALAGVTRGIVLKLARRLGLKTKEENIRPAALQKVDGVLLSLSSIGVAEGISLNGKPLKLSPLTPTIHIAYTALLSNKLEEW